MGGGVKKMWFESCLAVDMIWILVIGTIVWLYTIKFDNHRLVDLIKIKLRFSSWLHFSCCSVRFDSSFQPSSEDGSSETSPLSSRMCSTGWGFPSSPTLHGFTTPVLDIFSINPTSSLASYSFCSSLIPSNGFPLCSSTHPVTGLILIESEVNEEQKSEEEQNSFKNKSQE